MRDNSRYLYLFFVIFLVMDTFSWAKEDWTEIKGEHFIVHYQSSNERDLSERVLREAEVYYTKIANDIGYARYRDFWTWEDRVKVFIYPDQETYMKETGQPVWSSGFVLRDAKLIETKLIVSFAQETDFVESVLPHEISHLILKDFIGFDKSIPVWFDEGIAQLQEAGKVESAERVMKSLVAIEKYLPFKQLFDKKEIKGDDPLAVAIFYAQSMCVLDFLIKKYGSHDFGQLCVLMKEGKNFEEALRSVYVNTFDSVEEFEKKWLNEMRNGLETAQAGDPSPAQE